MTFGTCPSCKKTVHETFRYCPFCGVGLLESSTQLNASELNRLFGTVDIGVGGIHEQAENRLREIGGRLGYEAYSGYGIPRTLYQSRIDVVWFSEDKVIAAFAVHGKRRNLGIVLGYKDQEALAAVQAKEKFFVNVSTTTGKAYFHRLHPDLSIEYAQVSGEAHSHIEDTKKVYPRAFDAWTVEEDEQLIKRFKEGITISELASIHQRTPWSIQLRLESLGVLPPHSSSTRAKTESNSNVETMKTYDVDEIRKEHPRAYEEWTDAEDADLLKNYRDGLSVSELAKRHQRQGGAIRSRLRKLGLIRDAAARA